ncbi:protein-methionine-sulfoxide reductase heme-binding subunit MsrQ [Sphingomicrobium arenosum]|uniref:sulfite oxidase heme-binding subunit YedZ n=1 Tax=Sphingomicrobium arenosum TaxID=2233861 RepID=UPI002240D6E7|nr:ferric reductase-like transmembrane domain-containing protein [Sphingomicrobium arenosum]
MRLSDRTVQQRLLWLVLALPALWGAGRWAFTPEVYGYGHAIGDSGDWAAWLLMVTLAVTPIKLAWRKSRVATRLVRHRRDLGVASFAYAAIHTAIYLSKKGAAAFAGSELSTDYIWSGWAAMALFVPLAVTSNDASMRWLKARWKRLHRLVYPAAVLMLLHWVWSAYDATTAMIHVGIMAAIFIARLWLSRPRA